MKEGAQQEKEMIAINALKNGFDLNTIQDLTGLSVDQIRALSKKMNL